MPDTGAMRGLPRYRCHKEVWALKIKAIEFRKPIIAGLERLLNEQPAADGDNVGAIITPEDPRYGPFPVSFKYVNRHEPKEGGYYVVYPDGYLSWSPAEAFESGYTLCS